MRKFSELGITNKQNSFVGDKIKISKIINREVIIHDYKIEDSKFPKNKTGKCLHLQIELDNVKSIVFTGSDVLINTIQEIDKKQLPISTTILKDGECYIFS